MRYQILYFLILVLSCSNSPGTTAKKMIQKGCTKDVEGFFSYINKAQVNENLGSKFLEETQTPDDQLGAFGQALSHAITEKFLPEMLNQVWKGYENEIEKGKDGIICKMKVVLPTSDMKTNQVLLEAPNGERQIWAFAKSDNKWMLTGFYIQGKEAPPPDEVAFTETSELSKEELKDDPKPDEGKSDFRKIKWGMSKEEVKRAENAQFEQESEDDNILAFNARISHLSAYIFYFFVQDQLVRAGYAFTEKHTNKNDYINDFMKIKGILIEKYGEPNQDKTTWKGTLYQDDREHWGMAVSLGDLVYYAQWKTDRTTITQVLRGDNFDITHMVEYSSKELEHLEEKAKAKQEEEEF